MTATMILRFSIAADLTPGAPIPADRLHVSERHPGRPFSADDLRGKLVICLWRDVANVLSSDFSQSIQLTFCANSAKIRPRLRPFYQIDAMIEKLKVSTRCGATFRGGAFFSTPSVTASGGSKKIASMRLM
jgi:hypothetical protein